MLRIYFGLAVKLGDANLQTKAKYSPIYKHRAGEKCYRECMENLIFIYF